MQVFQLHKRILPNEKLQKYHKHFAHRATQKILITKQSIYIIQKLYCFVVKAESFSQKGIGKFIRH